MPQDGRRSAGYRPFVTCSDPDGVVECGTIRKSKLSSYQKMEPSISSQMRLKNPNKSLEPKSEEKDQFGVRKNGEELCGPASFQLLEVSKGAQKLNHMIETWSRGLSVEGQPKDLAKDLLKGALDLQESLMMLGKLQAASKYVARLKRKQEKADQKGGQKLEECPNDDRDGFLHKEEVFSVDESSRKKVEELREVIRSSFERQNLLPNGRVGAEKGHFCRYDSESDIPSTSSSQSSVNCNERVNDSLEKKAARGPGIIAKLMGLEEISSKPAQQTSLRKLLQQHERPVFNIDMPKLKNPHVEIHTEDHGERKTLKEVLETMQFKGLLKDNPVKRDRLFKYPRHEYMSHDNIPPIVLIKPLPAPSLGKKVPLLQERDAADAIPAMRSQEGSEVIDSTKERRAVKSKQEVWKIEKEQHKEETSDKVNLASGSSNGELLKKQVTTKKQRDHEKVTKGGGRKSPEKGTSNVQPSQNRAVEIAKLENKANAMKKEVSQQGRENRSNCAKKEPLQRQRNDLKSISTQRKDISSQKGEKKNQKNNQKTVNKPKEPKTDKLVKSKAPRKEDDGKIDSSHDIETVKVESNSTHMDQESTKENVDASDSCFIEQHGIKDEPTVLSTAKGCNYDDRKSFLLRSQSFLLRAEELFSFVSSFPLMVEEPEKFDSRSANERLYLDCANELMECKSLQESEMVHFVVPVPLRSSTIFISLEKLVEEVCNGIESLSSYCSFASEGLAVDGFYAMLKRDLYQNRGLMGHKLWGRGWSRGFSADDAEQVVNELQETILSRLILETF